VIVFQRIQATLFECVWRLNVFCEEKNTNTTFNAKTILNAKKFLFLTPQIQNNQKKHQNNQKKTRFKKTSFTVLEVLV